MVRLAGLFTTCLIVGHFATASAVAGLGSCRHMVSSLIEELSGREGSGLDLRKYVARPGKPRPPVGAVKLEPLDQIPSTDGKKTVEMFRLDSGENRPDRETVNEILGWKAGSYKIVLLAQEIDNTKQGRLTRLGIALGAFSSKHLHLSVAFIDPEGNWFRANPTGPMERIQKGDYLSRGVAYLPLDLSAAEAVKAADGIRKSIGTRSPFGCANGSCQTVADALGSDARFPMTASHTISHVLEEQKLPVTSVFTAGTTTVSDFNTLRKGVDAAEMNLLRPFVPVIGAALGLGGS